MAMLDKEEAIAVQHAVEEIANSYPQALVYPFMISSESFSFQETVVGHRNKEFVARWGCWAIHFWKQIIFIAGNKKLYIPKSTYTSLKFTV